MPGAAMYTTSRGKNKKAKEAKRKDHNNNLANKLMSQIRTKDKTTELDGGIDKSQWGKIQGIGSHKSRDQKATIERERLRMQLDAIKAASQSGCSNQSCESHVRAAVARMANLPPPVMSLRACKACNGHASYCGAECQKAHWPRHKAACKAIQNGEEPPREPEPTFEFPSAAASSSSSSSAGAGAASANPAGLPVDYASVLQAYLAAGGTLDALNGKATTRDPAAGAGSAPGAGAGAGPSSSAAAASAGEGDRADGGEGEEAQLWEAELPSDGEDDEDDEDDEGSEEESDDVADVDDSGGDGARPPSQVQIDAMD